MPSTSKAQARLMAAAAHTQGGFGGVPQKVGKEFNRADTASGAAANTRRSESRKFNKGGSVCAPSVEQQFENNIAETAANPTGGKPLWRRW